MNPDTDRPASMSRLRRLRGVAIRASVCCALVACSHGTSDNGGQPAATGSATSSHANWTDNGATACDTYLTPAVAADILKNPAGHAKRLSGQACSYETADFSSITITLMQGGTTGLDTYIPHLPDPVPIAGIGDKAVRTMLGIDAAKGADRMCSIDLMPPFAAKVSGEALAQKLGVICNQLFALP